MCVLISFEQTRSNARGRAGSSRVQKFGTRLTAWLFYVLTRSSKTVRADLIDCFAMQARSQQLHLSPQQLEMPAACSQRRYPVARMVFRARMRAPMHMRERRCLPCRRLLLLVYLIYDTLYYKCDTAVLGTLHARAALPLLSKSPREHGRYL